MSARPVSGRAIASLLCATALLVLTLGAAGPAQAHDTLVSTSPEDGATVAATPDEIVLTFDQPAVAVGTQLRVDGPGGEVQQGRPVLVDTTVRQGVEPGSPAGTYTVTWRVTSADGHPVSGTFSFTSRAPGTPAPSGGVTTPAPSASATTGGADATGSAPRAGKTSTTSTGGSDESGTSWAVWLVVAVLVLAAVGAAAVRVRRGRGGRSTR